MSLAGLNWLFVLGALALAVVAVGMLLCALGGDWLLGVAHFRSTGERRRRCPKCWYDMYGVEGLRCPECGREATHVGALMRSRRRWRWVVAACVPMAGAVALWFHDARWSERHRYYPTRALVALVEPAALLRSYNGYLDTPCMDELGKRFRRGKASAWSEAALARKLERALAGRPLVTVHPDWQPGEPLRVRTPVLTLRPSCTMTLRPRETAFASIPILTIGYGSCGIGVFAERERELEGVVLGPIREGVHSVVFDVELTFSHREQRGQAHNLTPISLPLPIR